MKYQSCLTTTNIPISRLLLLEDHVLVAECFKEILNKILPLNCSVDFLTSVESARDMLATHTYNFLLTDLILPDQNVKEFISYCRRQYPGLIIIVISAVTDITTIKECLRMGAAGYLSKSVQVDELRLALENTFNGRKYISSDLNDKLTTNLLEMGNSILTKAIRN